MRPRITSTAFAKEVDVSLETCGRSRALKKTHSIRGLTPEEAARVLALMQDAKTESVAIDEIHPSPHNVRRHPPKQVAILASAISALPIQFSLTRTARLLRVMADMKPPDHWGFPRS
jgi:hypothetical protein